MLKQMTLYQLVVGVIRTTLIIHLQRHLPLRRPILDSLEVSSGLHFGLYVASEVWQEVYQPPH